MTLTPEEIKQIEQEAKPVDETDYQPITCPFCGFEDMDKIGFKHHLRNHCEEYDNTPNP